MSKGYFRSVLNSIELGRVVRQAKEPVLIRTALPAVGVMSGADFMRGVHDFRDKTILNEPGVFVFSKGKRIRNVGTVIGEGLNWADDPTKGCHSTLAPWGGLTFRLTNVHLFHNTVSDLRDAIMEVTSGMGGINAYYSTPHSGAAIPFHKDPGIQIIVQLKGKKIWYFDEKDLGLCLEEGDILIIPLVMRHRAEAKEFYSLHLTMMLNPIPELRILDMLMEVCRDASSFSASKDIGAP